MKYDPTLKTFNTFLGWLFSDQRQTDMPGQGRSFRRQTSQFWNLWPLPPKIDTPRPFIYADGIHLGRKAVVLIARDDEHVLGWYLARSENSAAWSALFQRITAPRVLICDGGSGIAKAMRQQWPNTVMQRCLFHVWTQIRTQTTLKPRLQPGVELLGLAHALLHIHDQQQATNWLQNYNHWCNKWRQFLAQKTITPTGIQDTHKRLVKARQILNGLVRAKTLFTYLDPELADISPIPSTTNKIEGATNAALRDMLRKHRGMNLARRVKAIFWHCYIHSPNPLTPAEILKTMPTDNEIQHLYKQAHHQQPTHLVPANLITWTELHQNTYRWN